MDYLEPKKKVGLVVVLTGHGKGKTSSALSAWWSVPSAMGCGFCVISFMKGDLDAGEYDGLKSLPGVEHHLTGKGSAVSREIRTPTPNTGATPRTPSPWRRRNSSPVRTTF